MDNISIGTDATGERIETSPTGAIAEPADRYWGGQTQRSEHYFLLCDDRMPTFGFP